METGLNGLIINVFLMNEIFHSTLLFLGGTMKCGHYVVCFAIHANG